MKWGLKLLCLFAVAVGLALPLSAEEISQFELAERIKEKAAKNEKLVFRMSYLDPSISFAVPIRQGIKAAAEEFGVDAKMVGSVGGKIHEQIAELETLISMEVDGLGVAATSEEALATAIDKGMKAGIPVVGFNSECRTSHYFGFVGQDLVGAARTQGHMIACYLHGKGKVIIFSCASGAPWSLDRERGVREGLAQYKGIEVIGLVDATLEEGKCYAAVESTFMANPDIAGVATLDCMTTPAVGRYILRQGLAGKIVHVGHDFIPETLDNVKAGATTATISQDPFLQGYLPVKMMYEFVTKGIPIHDYDTGALVCDKYNVQEWLDKLAAGEPVG